MSISDEMMKKRTGFVNESAMLAFVCAVCNGDIQKIKETHTSNFTWYEEWMLYFEAVWGRTHTTWDRILIE
jgi:hypothetical protein